MNPGKSAKEIMVTRLLTIPSDMLLPDAARFLLKHRIGCAPVVDPEAGIPVGELSREACIDALLDEVYEGLSADPVSATMLPWRTTVSAGASIVEMVSKFRESPQKFLPVYRDDSFLGIVTRTALIQTLLSFLEHMPDHESRLLYLSAIRDQDEAPGL